MEVVGSIALSMTVALPRKAAGLLPLEAGPEDLDREPLGDQPRHPVEVAGGDLDVDAHRVELPDDRQLGVVGAAAPGRRADEVAQLDLGQADPAVDRRGHPAVAQVDLGVGDPGLRPGDVGLGGEDVRLVVGLGLLQAGLVGLDLRRVLLADRLLALDVLDRGGVPLQQRLLAPLLDLGEREHRLAERELCRRDLPRLGVLRLLQGGLGLLQRRLGLGELGLEGLLVDDEQELARLDVAALLEVDLLEEPAHPGADGDLLEGPRRPDRLGHDRDGHPPGLDDGDHRGRRRPRRPDLGGATRRSRADAEASPRRDPPAHPPTDSAVSAAHVMRLPTGVAGSGRPRGPRNAPARCHGARLRPPDRSRILRDRAIARELPGPGDVEDGLAAPRLGGPRRGRTRATGSRRRRPGRPGACSSRPGRAGRPGSGRRAPAPRG